MRSNHLPVHSRPATVPQTPALVLEGDRLRENGRRVRALEEACGCQVILALKAFATPAAFPFLDGIRGSCCSSVFEIQLASSHGTGGIHIFAPAWHPGELHALATANPRVSHITFNSLYQYQRDAPELQRDFAAQTQLGLRVNPGWRGEKRADIYNPAAPLSRLGIPIAQVQALTPAEHPALTGLHVHLLSEASAADLDPILHDLETHLSDWLRHIRWVNLGGGHLLADDDYDRDHLADRLRRFTADWDLDRVYLEPGLGLVTHAGTIHTTVLDLVKNEVDIAILDASATAHIPEVTEMPWAPPIVGATPVIPDQPPVPGKYRYRLGGRSCLAGDFLGTYDFPSPIERGHVLQIQDVAAYSTVRNSWFNGLCVPQVYLRHPDTGDLQPLRTPNFDDYLANLGVTA